MSLSRTHVWTFLEKLSSTQLNAIDENVTRALDKRSGQTDTLASDVSFEGRMFVTGTFDTKSDLTTGTNSFVTLRGTTTMPAGHSHSIFLTNTSSYLSASQGGKINVGSAGKIELMPSSRMDVTGTVQLANNARQLLKSGSMITAEAGAGVNIFGNLSFIGSSAKVDTNLIVDGTLNAEGDFEVVGTTTLQDVVLGDDSNTITYGTTKTKVVRQSLLSNAMWYRFTGVTPTVWSDFVVDQTGGDFPIALKGTAGDSTNYKKIVAQIINPLDGATLKYCALGYKPASTSAPSTSRIRFNVYRYPIDGSAAESLFSGGMSVVSLYDSTAWTSQLMTLNQNNVIDTENYTYVVIIEDDRVGNIGNLFSTLIFTYEFTNFTRAAL